MILALPQHPCYADGEGYDHDWVYGDASFDHEYGTEVCGFYECTICGATDIESDPPGHEDYDIDRP